MAIITCPECGKQISEYAPACVGCGVPMEMIKKLLVESESSKESATVVTGDNKETVQVKTRDSDYKTEDQLQRHMVSCIICGTNFDIANYHCPKCNYSVLSLSSQPNSNIIGTFQTKYRGIIEDRLVKRNKETELVDAEEQYSLGLSYDLGEGVKQNKAKAVEWYRKAAEQGHADAQNSLGYLYENGIGVEKNYKKAVEWYDKAAEQGHADAQIRLGDLHKNGIGIERNYDRAVEWYQKAADQGNAKAQYNLGVSYEKGLGVEKSLEKATEWYQKAADQGYPPAINKLVKFKLFSIFGF